jgi:hypothetical protein
MAKERHPGPQTGEEIFDLHSHSANSSEDSKILFVGSADDLEETKICCTAGKIGAAEDRDLK